MSVTLLEYMLTVNVALNKPTYLLKPFNDASNAVNGYKPTLSSSEAECLFISWTNWHMVGEPYQHLQHPSHHHLLPGRK